MSHHGPLLDQLEACAQILMAPPNLVTAQQLHQAQHTFLEFQKSKQPFEACRALLENSSTAYVKFQAAACLKNGVIRDWAYLKEDDRKLHLLTYLFEYTGREHLEPFVREQLLLVCAIVLKRIGIDERTSEQSARLADRPLVEKSVVTDMLNSLLHMLTTVESDGQATSPSSLHKKFTAVSFLMAILGEYASSTRASDFGLPWVKHLEAKKQFEVTHLKNVFSAVLTATANLLQGSDSIRLVAKQAEPLGLLLKLLQLLEAIMSWNFDVITIISSQYAKHVDSIETPVLQPHVDWRDTLINDQTIQFIFYIYVTVRQLNQETLVHHALQCLSQLSSLTGAVLSNAKLRLQFVNSLLSGALHVMTSDLAAFEITPISSMVYRICIHLQNRDTIQHVDKSVTFKFCQLMAQLTCQLLTGGLKAESGKHVDDEFDRYKQSIDQMCDAWMVLLQAVEKHDRRDDVAHLSGHPQRELIDPLLLATCTKQMFTCYLRCHLSVPEGLREPPSLDHEEDEDEIEEFEEVDAIAFADQLNAMGCVARVDLKHSVSCLSQLLAIRVDKLQRTLQAMASQGKASVPTNEWSAINEDIHWLVMITTWTLTQCNYGERDLIPNEVTKLSVSTQSDLNKTMQVLASRDVDVAHLSSSEQIDPIVSIISIVFKLCQLEQHVMDNNLQLFSPQVSSTLSSFVARFMSGFLLVNESDYTEMSINLISCFGKGTKSSTDTLEFLVGHVLSKVFAWSSESDLKESSANCLVQFASNSNDRTRALMSTTPIQKVLSEHTSGILAASSPQTRHHVYHLLVLLVSQRPELWPQLYDPLKAKYQLIQSAIASGDRSEQTRNDLIELCDCLGGLCAGCGPSNVASVWTHFLAHIYQSDLARLLDVMHNYSAVVVALLELASNATNRILCFLGTIDTLAFYEATISLLNIYSKHNKGRSSTEVTADEESCQDIYLIMQILSDLTAKDFIDWFPPPPGSNQGAEGSTVSATQVVFLGLGVVMPLMTSQLLDFPKLSTIFYKVITFLCEDPDRLAEVPPALMSAIAASVQHALKSSFSSEIKCNCLSMLFILAGHRIRDPEQFKFLGEMLEPFLSVIFEFTLFEVGSCKDVTLREQVANTMFMLICCFPQTYSLLVEQLIVVNVQSRHDQEEARQLDHDLRTSFSCLMDDIPTNAAQLRSRRTSFKQRFEVFVTDLQGLLRIK